MVQLGKIKAMKATDLRIGNLIYSDTKQVTVIDGFMNDSVYKNVDDERVRFILSNITYCNGIPLTEEWLFKFGFKRFPWGLVAGNLLFKDNLKCTELTFEVGNGFRVEIKYVHQLQNLYFALTGEELTI